MIPQACLEAINHTKTALWNAAISTVVALPWSGARWQALHLAELHLGQSGNRRAQALQQAQLQLHLMPQPSLHLPQLCAEAPTSQDAAMQEACVLARSRC